MGKNNKNSKRNTSSSKKQQQLSDWAYVDPSKIRYQHARIRPYFRYMLIENAICFCVSDPDCTNSF